MPLWPLKQTAPVIEDFNLPWFHERQAKYLVFGIIQQYNCPTLVFFECILNYDRLLDASRRTSPGGTQNIGHLFGNMLHTWLLMLCY